MGWFHYHKPGPTRRIEFYIDKSPVLVDTGVSEDFIDKVLLWGYFFMPDYLRDESPEFHRDLIALFFSKRNEYIAAPRGFSKTTIIQLCISFSVVNKLDNFIVLIEKSFTEAAEVLSAVREVLLTSELVRLVYGQLNISEDEGSKDPDAKGDLMVNGVRLRAKGFNITIRGLKSHAYRPSKIILDDCESDEHINNPEQRLKYLDNFNKGIQPAIDIDGVIKVFGTILHFDSLLMNLINWHQGKIYRAHNEQDMTKDLLWPKRWTVERLQKKKEDMTSKKGSDAYTQEYLNNPVSDEARTFRQKWLWNPERTKKLADLKGKMLNGYAAIDVADSTKEGSDWTGVVVHLVDQEGNHYRASCRRERRNILGKVDLIFEIWKTWREWGLIEIGVEKKAFNDEILPLLDKEKQIRQVYPIVSELKPLHNSKTNRIKGNLQGPYEQGKIWTIVNESGEAIEDTEKLLNELYNFPNAQNDDLSDAEAYIIDMAQVPLGGNLQNMKQTPPQDDPWGDPIPGGNNDDPFAD